MKNETTTTIVLSFIFAAIFAFLLYSLIIYTIVEPDLHETHREISVIDFYQNSHGGGYIHNWQQYGE
jgi:hypothetical protein